MVAHARDDRAVCLLETAEVRPTYRRALGIAGVVAEPAPSLVGRDLPFRLRRDAVALLERFPCAAEVDRLTWWAAHADLQSRGPLAASVTAALPGLASMDPVRCFDQVETAVATLGLDWVGADPSPAHAPCDRDLALTGAYREGVFDDRLGAATRPALDRAAEANRRGDARSCIAASADVRRAYLAAVGARPRELPVGTIAVPDVPFPIRPGARPLLERFPCEEEARRLAWWLDRADVATPGSAEVDGSALLRRIVGLPPTACLSVLRAAPDAPDLDWRTGHEPPPGAPCSSDVALAAGYFDAVFDRPLREATQRRLAAAVTALQQGDHATCLVAAAGVRRMYWQGLGVPPGGP